MSSTNTKIPGYRSPMSKPVHKANRRCAIFNCDRRHGNTCCADCFNRASCKNPCLNNPQQCGQVKVEVVNDEER